MAKETSISWTHHTFNPWHGCQKVSPACENCYAMNFSARCGFTGVQGPDRMTKAGVMKTPTLKPLLWGGAKSDRRFFGDAHWREPEQWNRDAVNAQRQAYGLHLPRQRVFCASMADVFEDRGDLTPHLHRLFALVIDTPLLDWLFLTKRPEAWAKRLEAVLRWNENNGGRADVHAWALDWLSGDKAPPNVWMGATAENQFYVDKRTDELRAIPARVRFLSMEPLLEAVSFRPKSNTLKEKLVSLERGDASRPALLDGIHWVIVGGESGGVDKRRPFEIEWLQGIANQCDAAGVALHVKQDAGGTSGLQGRIPAHLWDRKEFPALAAA